MYTRVCKPDARGGDAGPSPTQYPPLSVGALLDAYLTAMVPVQELKREASGKRRRYSVQVARSTAVALQESRTNPWFLSLELRSKAEKVTKAAQRNSKKTLRRLAKKKKNFALKPKVGRRGLIKSGVGPASGGKASSASIADEQHIKRPPTPTNVSKAKELFKHFDPMSNTGADLADLCRAVSEMRALYIQRLPPPTSPVTERLMMRQFPLFGLSVRVVEIAWSLRRDSREPFVAFRVVHSHAIVVHETVDIVAAVVIRDGGGDAALQPRSVVRCKKLFPRSWGTRVDAAQKVVVTTVRPMRSKHTQIHRLVSSRGTSRTRWRQRGTATCFETVLPLAGVLVL